MKIIPYFLVFSFLISCGKNSSWNQEPHSLAGVNLDTTMESNGITIECPLSKNFSVASVPDRQEVAKLGKTCFYDVYKYYKEMCLDKKYNENATNEYLNETENWKFEISNYEGMSNQDTIALWTYAPSQHNKIGRIKITTSLSDDAIIKKYGAPDEVIEEGQKNHPYKTFVWFGQNVTMEFEHPSPDFQYLIITSNKYLSHIKSVKKDFENELTKKL